MHSEFYNVELDRIRYSLVWEDFNTLSNGLQFCAHDNLLVITSAGCNVLNSVLLPVRHVTAIDINPVQNNLLRFKMHVIKQHNYDTYKAIMGFKGGDHAQRAWWSIKQSLPDSSCLFWDDFFAQHTDGILVSGKLENYLTRFFSTLDGAIQRKLQKLFTFSDVASQLSFFSKELNVPAFRDAFILYFNEVNLSKGRDAKLFKYAEEKSGETFYNRLVDHVSKFLVMENFFLRFFFFNPEEIPDNLLPLCYQEQNFEHLRSNLHKISIVDGEAIEFLLSDKGLAVTKASLSNIFEYTTHEDFNSVCKAITTFNPSLTFMYWNLLQAQSLVNVHGYQVRSLPAQRESCFYFKNANSVSQKN